MCACGERLSDDLGCLACGKEYKRAAKGLVEGNGEE
jgi:hypothetical protein